MDFFEFGDSPLMISESSFCCAPDIHTGHISLFSEILSRGWVVWLSLILIIVCLIDVSRWLIDDDRCFAGDVIFFVVHQISTLGHISPLFRDP